MKTKALKKINKIAVAPSTGSVSLEPPRLKKDLRLQIDGRLAQLEYDFGRFRFALKELKEIL